MGNHRICNATDFHSCIWPASTKCPVNNTPSKTKHPCPTTTSATTTTTESNATNVSIHANTRPGTCRSAGHHRSDNYATYAPSARLSISQLYSVTKKHNTHTYA